MDANHDADCLEAQVDAVLAVSGVLVSMAARSVADLEEPLTLPQLRILVLVASQSVVDLQTVAQTLEVHPSNATRTCDRLVSFGLLNRYESEADRRRRLLALTGPGEELVSRVMQRRREAVQRVLVQIPRGRRREVVSAMEDFATATGDLPV